MLANNGKFLRTDRIPYHSGGVETYLIVTRSPTSVSVAGCVNGGAQADGGMNFQASADPALRNFSLSDKAHRGTEVGQFFKAVKMAESQFNDLTSEMLHFQKERNMVRAMEAECYGDRDCNALLLMLAFRPTGMSRTWLAHCVGLVSSCFNHKEKGDRDLKSFLANSGDIWKYDILINALAELDAAGTPEEAEETFIGLATTPELMSEDDAEYYDVSIRFSERLG